MEENVNKNNVDFLVRSRYMIQNTKPMSSPL